jgi:hypothetical protein
MCQPEKVLFLSREDPLFREHNFRGRISMDVEKIESIRESPTLKSV